MKIRKEKWKFENLKGEVKIRKEKWKLERRKKILLLKFLLSFFKQLIYCLKERRSKFFERRSEKLKRRSEWPFRAIVVFNIGFELLWFYSNTGYFDQSWEIWNLSSIQCQKKSISNQGLKFKIHFAYIICNYILL